MTHLPLYFRMSLLDMVGFADIIFRFNAVSVFGTPAESDRRTAKTSESPGGGGGISWRDLPGSVADFFKSFTCRVLIASASASSEPFVAL